MTIPNKTYDCIRFIAELLLPGLATLYAALAPVWGFPYAQEIVTTVIAVDTFLGLFVNYLRKRYNLNPDPIIDERGDDDESDS